MELVLDDGGPLVRFMAFGSRTELVKEEQHRRGQVAAGRVGACHQVTVPCRRRGGANSLVGRMNDDVY